MYIQQEVTPAFQVGAVGVASERAEGAGAPVKGRVVEEVHRGAPPRPGAPCPGNVGDPSPPLVAGGVVAAVRSRVSPQNLRGVPPEAARGPDEGPRR